IASGIARALPSPAPTYPLPSPTITSALQLMLRPPLVVFWHLLVRTTRSSRLSVSGLIFATIAPSKTEVRLPARCRQEPEHEHDSCSRRGRTRRLGCLFPDRARRSACRPLSRPPHYRPI